MYTYTHIYTYIHRYAYIYIYIIHTHIYTYAYIDIYTSACILCYVWLICILLSLRNYWFGCSWTSPIWVRWKMLFLFRFKNLKQVNSIWRLTGWFTPWVVFADTQGVWDKLCTGYSGMTAQHSILIPFYISSYAECLRAANQLNYKDVLNHWFWTQQS